MPRYYLCASDFDDRSVALHTFNGASIHAELEGALGERSGVYRITTSGYVWDASGLRALASLAMRLARNLDPEYEYYESPNPGSVDLGTDGVE